MKLKSFYALSDQGPFLNTNEDDYEFDFQKGLYMIFDGIGGSGIGDKTAAETKTFIRDYYGTLTADREATHPFFYSSKYLLEGLEKFARDINDQVAINLKFESEKI